MSETITASDVVVVRDGDVRSAYDVARDFVRLQSEGEWGDEIEERDTKRLAAVLTAFRQASSREVIVPWRFNGHDCLHPQGHEAGCRIMGCPRKTAAA